MTEQLSLFTIHPVQVSKPISDPYWDEIECGNVNPVNSTIDRVFDDLGGLLSPSLSKSAHQHTEQDSWNPADFGEVPHKADGDQLTIFYDDSHEPPDPDDYPNLTEYEQACREWQLLVGEQVSSDTRLHTVHSLVGEQVQSNTKKSAHQHDRQPTQYQAPQKVTHWVEKYWVERSGSKHWYYRYAWMHGRKINRRYIGSAQSAIAKNRKLEIESAIADGDSPSQIQNLIRSWKS